MSKKLIELNNGLMVEVEVSESEIEMISGGDDIVSKVQASTETVEMMLIQSV